MATSTQEIGGLKCRLYDELPPGEEPRIVAIFCHGFGAGGDDLLGLGPEFVLRKPELASAVRFIFPEAPLSLEELGMPGARA